MSRLIIPMLVLALVAPVCAQATPTDAEARAQLSGLRLPFIANSGQVDTTVAYYAPTFAGTLFVTQQGQVVYGLPGWSLTETLVEGRPRPVGQDPSGTGVSYFFGSDPAGWRPKVATYEQVSLGEVWSGVAVSLRAHGRSIEKVFTVSPGTSVDRIRVRVGGADTLSVNSAGALVAGTGLGAVSFTAPVAYQERDGVRREVAVAYRLAGREYGFIVGAYDRSVPLVIDPLLQSTYLGGSGNDAALALAIHPTTGDVYMAGSTESTNFPGVAGGVQTMLPSDSVFPIRAAFVARLSGDLKTLIQATYLGGSAHACPSPHFCPPGDFATALAIHPTNGDVYVTGLTAGINFPSTAGGAQAAYGGGGQDAFVVRLSSSLTALIQATYLGGSGNDQAMALVIHPMTGDIYVAGVTVSNNFPGVAGGAQPTSGGVPDAFVARLSSSLTVLTQATYLGGSSYETAQALAIHPVTGDVYVSGYTASFNFPGTVGGVQPTKGVPTPLDAFVARLNSALTTLIQATFLGGSDDELGSVLAIHPTTGDIFVAGSTASSDFPGVGGGFQPTKPGAIFIPAAFIARLSQSLTALTQATYFGGNSNTAATALAIHPANENVYIAGPTRATDLPGTSGGVQPTKASGMDLTDAFLARLPSSLTALTQATYLGGSADNNPSALAIRPSTGDVYVAGTTTSTDFPGTSGGAQPANGGMGDAFVARLTFSLAQVDPSVPDLKLSKAHVGNFAWGEVGAVYTLTVSNVGTAPTAGMVTVTDTLPAGLTATALSGTGWSCTLGTRTCTRSDALGAGASYPAITLTVNVATDAPSPVTNTATVSGGGDTNPDNNTANDVTPITSFTDVPITHPFLTWIEALLDAGITGGCSTSPPQYCPDTAVTRAQIAVFLLRGIHGAGFSPSAATGMVFTDVPASHPLAKWIEGLAGEGVTGGCATTPPRYCPDDGVTRGQMAVLLLRAVHGAGYQAPAATGTMFGDVPVSHPFAAWIEQLAREGVTGGCSTSPPLYCPDAPVTRAQMAVFLVRAFNLPH